MRNYSPLEITQNVVEEMLYTCQMRLQLLISQRCDVLVSVRCGGACVPQKSIKGFLSVAYDELYKHCFQQILTFAAQEEHRKLLEKRLDWTSNVNHHSIRPGEQRSSARLVFQSVEEYARICCIKLLSIVLRRPAARLVLNYKNVEYITLWTEYPEIAPTFKNVYVWSCKVARKSNL